PERVDAGGAADIDDRPRRRRQRAREDLRGALELQLPRAGGKARLFGKRRVVRRDLGRREHRVGGHAPTATPTFRATSPTRIAPGCTTLAQRPRRRSRLPSAELTNFMASRPKRSTNLPQPVCGMLVTSTTADPSASRVPGGRLSSLRSRSTNRDRKSTRL